MTALLAFFVGDEGVGEICDYWEESTHCSNNDIDSIADLVSDVHTGELPRINVPFKLLFNVEYDTHLDDRGGLVDTVSDNTNLIHTQPFMGLDPPAMPRLHRYMH